MFGCILGYSLATAAGFAAGYITNEVIKVIKESKSLEQDASSSSLTPGIIDVEEYSYSDFASWIKKNMTADTTNAYIKKVNFATIKEYNFTNDLLNDDSKKLLLALTDSKNNVLLVQIIKYEYLDNKLEELLGDSGEVLLNY